VCRLAARQKAHAIVNREQGLDLSHRLDLAAWSVPGESSLDEPVGPDGEAENRRSQSPYALNLDMDQGN
jgi:hypothetical protein